MIDEEERSFFLETASHVGAGAWYVMVAES